MKKLYFLFLILIFATGCAKVYDPIVKREVRTLYSEEQETELGRQVADHIEKEFEICPESSRKLQKLGVEVAESSDRPHLEYQFKVLKSDEINAFALPGGFVYVYSGLLDILTNDETAAVLGHEIAHICARHGIKRIQAVYAYQFFTLAGLIALKDEVDPKAAQELADSVFTLVLLGYSRRDEFEADRLGVRYAAEAGFSPGGMIGVLQKLQEKQKNAPEIPFFSTHPPARERIKEVKIVIAALEQEEMIE
jgi:beta-barrel assembly-enhancing protease